MARAFPLLTVAVDGPIADNIPVMLHTRTSELVHFSQHVHDPDRVAELHAMRIAAKRLRYTIEIFQPYVHPPELAELTAKLLASTKTIQEKIGEIHDRDVRIPLIHAYLSKREHKSPELRPGLSRLISEDMHDRDRLYSEFITHWDAEHDTYLANMMELISSITTWKETASNKKVTAKITPVHSNGKSEVRKAAKAK